MGSWQVALQARPGCRLGAGIGPQGRRTPASLRLRPAPDVLADTPTLQKAVGLGGFVLYGSDPLPRSGDEYSAGSYATLIDAPFDENAPASSILSALHTATLMPVGRRHGLSGTLRRLR